jgi:hypothetical protein
LSVSPLARGVCACASPADIASIAAPQRAAACIVFFIAFAPKTSPFAGGSLGRDYAMRSETMRE